MIFHIMLITNTLLLHHTVVMINSLGEGFNYKAEHILVFLCKQRVCQHKMTSLMQKDKM